MRTLAAILVCAVLAACGSGDSGPSWSDGKCNGFAALCDRRYDLVSYPTTHNAMSNDDEHWVAPNQSHPIARQLADGVRGLMLDTHYDQGVAALCHNNCVLGATPLADGLGTIHQFLTAHPGEILTLIFETYVSAADTRDAFVASGAMDDVYAHPAGTPWPTLREMITAGHRLVVFTDTDGGTYPWYLDEFTNLWENPYTAMTTADFACTVNRGQASNPLFVLNHFLGAPLPDPGLADQANHNPVLIDHAHRCMTESGRLPNFVTVDWYSIGDLFATVDSLNGVANP